MENMEKGTHMKKNGSAGVWVAVLIIAVIVVGGIAYASHKNNTQKAMMANDAMMHNDTMMPKEGDTMMKDNGTTMHDNAMGDTGSMMKQ